MLGLRRFPAIAFVLVWALLVAIIYPSSFHDARPGDAAAPPGPPPSLEKAYDTWLAAAPKGSARPLVLVAAEGGGIRAAVWTALVMECIFGPGPVKDDSQVCTHQGSFDAQAAAADVRANRLPVFLASGASGGSVGLAAWSARRVDLAAGDKVPSDIDQLLPGRLRRSRPRPPAQRRHAPPAARPARHG